MPYFNTYFIKFCVLNLFYELLRENVFTTQYIYYIVEFHLNSTYLRVIELIKLFRKENFAQKGIKLLFHAAKVTN